MDEAVLVALEGVDLGAAVVSVEGEDLVVSREVVAVEAVDSEDVGPAVSVVVVEVAVEEAVSRGEVDAVVVVSAVVVGKLPANAVMSSG